MIGRTGYMTHAESEKSIRLFGKEVLPAPSGDRAGRSDG